MFKIMKFKILVSWVGFQAWTSGTLIQSVTSKISQFLKAKAKSVMKVQNKNVSSKLNKLMTLYFTNYVNSNKNNYV